MLVIVDDDYGELMMAMILFSDWGKDNEMTMTVTTTTLDYINKGE